MPAPKGNKYYLLRSVDGRKKKFGSPLELWEAFLEYKKWCDDNPWQKKDAIRSGDNVGKIISIPTERPYTLIGFACYIGLTKRALDNYGSEKEYKDFFPIHTRISDICYSQKFEGAAVGAFNASIIARDLGLVEKKDVAMKHEVTEETAKEITELTKKFLNTNE